MKKIVIALMIIFVFTIFNNSVKAEDTCTIKGFLPGSLYSECTCENYECSGYRWYSVEHKCDGDCDCPEQRHCLPGSIYPYTISLIFWVEYECYTPRFGCDVGEDCNQGNPVYYYDDTSSTCYCQYS